MNISCRDQSLGFCLVLSSQPRSVWSRHPTKLFIRQETVMYERNKTLLIINDANKRLPGIKARVVLICCQGRKHTHTQSFISVFISCTSTKHEDLMSCSRIHRQAAGLLTTRPGHLQKPSRFSHYDQNRT